MSAFREHHEDSIRFGYRCFDRRLLNGLIQPFQQPERVVRCFTRYRDQYPVTRQLLRDIPNQYVASRWNALNAQGSWLTTRTESSWAVL